MKNNKITLLFAYSLILYGCSDPAERSAEYLKSAKAYYADENYSKARLELKNALQIDSQSAETYYYLALINEKNKSWKVMFNHLAKAVLLDPQHYPARLKLAKLYLLSGDLEKTKKEVDVLLDHNADNIDAIVLQGTLLFKQGDYLAALTEAEKALKIQPSHVDSINLQVVIYMAQQDYINAEEKVTEALLTAPNELALNLLKLQIHTQSKNNIAIEQDYQTLIQRFPNQFEFTYALAKFYVFEQRDAEALKLLENIVEKNAQRVELKLVLIDFLIQREPKKAKAVLTGFIENAPNEIDLRLKLANLHIIQENFDQAKPVLLWIVEHSQDSKKGLDAKILLAKLAIKNNDKLTALALLKEILAVDVTQYEALLLKARLNLADNLDDQAIADLRNIISDYPSSDEAIVLLAQAYLNKGSPELAEKNFRKALALNPSNFSAVMPVVSRMIQNGDITRADDILQKALKRKPDHAGALKALAQVKLLKKDWQGTQELIDLMATKPKGQSFSRYVAGKMSQTQGLYKQAVVQYKEALSINPTLSDALKSLVICYEALQQREQALSYLDKFISQHPKFSQPLLYKSQLYRLGKQWNKALGVLNKGLQQWPQAAQFYQEIATIYRTKKDFKKVIETYKKGLEKIPENAQLRMFLASTYEFQGDYDNALKNYEILIAKRPDFEMAINNLISLLLDHYPSVENIHRAVKLAERFEGSEQPYFLDTYGWALLYDGQLQKAIGLFKQAILKMPEFATFKYHLGLAYHKTENNMQAIELLEHALIAGSKQKRFSEKQQTEALLKQLNTKPKIF